MKNPASLTSEGAGGFSLPNKLPRFKVALQAAEKVPLKTLFVHRVVV
jgi:hypothetical protein